MKFLRIFHSIHWRNRIWPGTEIPFTEPLTPTLKLHDIQLETPKIVVLVKALLDTSYKILLQANIKIVCWLLYPKIPGKMPVPKMTISVSSGSENIGSTWSFSDHLHLTCLPCSFCSQAYIYQLQILRNKNFPLLITKVLDSTSLFRLVHLPIPVAKWLGYAGFPGLT